MKPARDLLREPLPKDAHCQVLAEPGRQYAIYFKGAPGFAWKLDLPAGKYRTEFLDAASGKTIQLRDLDHAGGAASLVNPGEPLEMALRIVRLGS
jgi:hypothetical protein